MVSAESKSMKHTRKWGDMYRTVFGIATAICCLGTSVVPAQTNPGGEAGEPGAAIGVQVISSSQMQKQDLALMDARKAEIAETAELYGYDLSAGTWIRNQVLCPAAPKHLLLHYVKISQDGAVSLFTAVIPRGHEQVRMIPVLYHGAQATRVFGSSPEQRQLINEVIPANQTELNATPKSNWSTLAYCYAALAGAEPTARSITSPEEITPILSLERPDGQAREMAFRSPGPDHLVLDWRILFDRNLQVKSIDLTARAVQPPQNIPIPKTTLKQSPIRNPK
jgi:hypothetical protein